MHQDVSGKISNLPRGLREVRGIRGSLRKDAADPERISEQVRPESKADIEYPEEAEPDKAQMSRPLSYGRAVFFLFAGEVQASMYSQFNQI